jgi:hypothetical protein
MAYFARVENGIVTGTLETRKEIVDSGIVGDPLLFVEYSLESKRPAVYGGTYRADINEFIDPSPYPSWSLDSNNDWQAPVEKPSDGKNYYWDEPNLQWVEIVSPA